MNTYKIESQPLNIKQMNTFGQFADILASHRVLAAADDIVLSEDLRRNKFVPILNQLIDGTITQKSLADVSNSDLKTIKNITTFDCDMNYVTYALTLRQQLHELATKEVQARANVEQIKLLRKQKNNCTALIDMYTSLQG